MKSKELIIEKLKVLGQLILKLAIAYVIVVITIEVFIDGIFNDYISNIVYANDRSLYYWCVSNKSGIILSSIVIVFCIITYRFFSQKVNEIKIHKSGMDVTIPSNLEFMQMKNILTVLAAL